MTAVDLFSGCGGLTSGLKRAGFRVLAAVELERKAAETYSLNHPDVRLGQKDIRDVAARPLMRQLRLRPGCLDLLAGCPPCQGFSRIRTRNGKRKARDQRNDLIYEFVRFVRAFRPRAVMLENVPGLKANRRFAEFRSELAALGYCGTYKVLDVSGFGVPQHRKRLIFVALRGKRSPQLCPASDLTISVRQAIGALKKPGKSGDAIHDLPERRSPKVARIIEKIPRDGGSRAALPRSLRLACHTRSDGFADVYGRMCWDTQSPTITGGCFNPSKGRFLHPSQNRAVTLREAALLQGFPPRYRFNVRHGKESIALLIGNALPPPFVTAHAKALKRALDEADF